jgi:rhamnogalacturonyl hydrolase YesR
MNYKLAILFFCFLFVAMDGISGNLKSKQVVKVAQKVADWQLANPNTKPMGDWVQGPFVNSLMAMSKLPGGEKYEAVAMEIGMRENWGVIETKWIGNDHCTPQAWIELYEIYKDTLMIAETLRALDKNMVDVAEMDDDLRFIDKNRKKWAWCDALFMSPPAFARMGKVTGEKKHYDFLNEWWWKVSDFYYNEEEQLYFRDETFFDKREPNGAKVFWSRGNGWVLGGLVRVLQYLPANDPMCAKYEQQFKEICEKVVKIQGEDGLWGGGLLDRKAHPQAETSGSAFFVYGLAYGINEGILDKATYMPATIKAWKALETFVTKEGMFTGIQPIGDAPVKYNKNNSMPYGVGAFLLASSEVYRMLEK